MRNERGGVAGRDRWVRESRDTHLAEPGRQRVEVAKVDLTAGRHLGLEVLLEHEREEEEAVRLGHERRHRNVERRVVEAAHDVRLELVCVCAARLAEPWDLLADIFVRHVRSGLGFDHLLQVELHLAQVVGAVGERHGDDEVEVRVAEGRGRGVPARAGGGGGERRAAGARAEVAAREGR